MLPGEVAQPQLNLAGKVAVDGDVLLRLLRQGPQDGQPDWGLSNSFVPLDTVDQSSLASAAPTFDRAWGLPESKTSSGLAGNIGLLGIGPSIWSTNVQNNNLRGIEDSAAASNVPSTNPWQQLNLPDLQQQTAQPRLGSILHPPLVTQSSLLQQAGSAAPIGGLLSEQHVTQQVTEQVSAFQRLAEAPFGCTAHPAQWQPPNEQHAKLGTQALAAMRQLGSMHITQPQQPVSSVQSLGILAPQQQFKSDTSGPLQQTMLLPSSPDSNAAAQNQQAGARSLSSASGSSTYQPVPQSGPTLAELLQAGGRPRTSSSPGGAVLNGHGSPMSLPMGQRVQVTQGQGGGPTMMQAIQAPNPPKGPPPSFRQPGPASPPQQSHSPLTRPGAANGSHTHFGSPAMRAVSPAGSGHSGYGMPTQRPPPPRPPLGAPFQHALAQPAVAGPRPPRGLPRGTGPVAGAPAGYPFQEVLGPSRGPMIRPLPGIPPRPHPPAGPPPPFAQRDAQNRLVRGRPGGDGQQLQEHAAQGNRVQNPPGKPHGALPQSNGLTANNVFKEFKTRNRHNTKLTMNPVADLELVSRQLEALANKLQAPAAERQAQLEAFKGVNDIVQSKWPQAQVKLFGSAANGLSIGCNNDIDVSLLLDEDNLQHDQKVKVVEELGPLLEDAGMQDVQVLARARVPVVKFVYPRTGTKVDITVNNVLACLNTQLIAEYCRIDARLKQLILLVKHWAKSRNVAEAYKGCLSSYCYVIMCIHCLQRQQPPILPNLQRIKPFTVQRRVGEWEVAFNANNASLDNFGTHNRMNLAELLLAFFDYWTLHHDYQSDVVSIRLGERISKSAKQWTSRVGSERHLICIEDPFQLDHDLGRNVDRHTLSTMLREFQRADELLHSHEQPVELLFQPWKPDGP